MANFVPKYTPQAVRFDSMITTINTALSDSYEKVNSIVTFSINLLSWD